MSQIMGPQVFLLCTMFSMITWILLQINNREIDEFEQKLDKSLNDPGKDLLFVNGKRFGKQNKDKRNYSKVYMV